MDTLNHSTQCLEAWRARGVDFPADIGALIDHLAGVLMQAPKFMLPTGGRPFDDADSISRMFHDLRLPFPCVALEFRAVGAIAENEATSSKRISLVWDLSGGCPPVFAALTGRTLSARRALLVQSISYFDQSQFWMPILGMVELNLDGDTQKLEVGSYDTALLDLTRHRVPAKTKRLHSYPSVVHFTSREMVYEYGEEQATNLVLADSGDEVLSALSFAALTTCANVSADVVAAPRALNKKRLANGKVPFFDTRVLVVGDQGYEGATPGASVADGGHASPRTHLRRGHVRRLESKNVWVNAAVVNPGVSESGAPRYRVDRPR